MEYLHMLEALIRAVDLGRKLRNLPPVSDASVEVILKRFEGGEVQLETFISGLPDPLAVYYLAVEYEAEHSTAH